MVKFATPTWVAGTPVEGTPHRSAATGPVGAREIGLRLVAHVLNCVSLRLLAQDLDGCRSVTQWDRDGRVLLGDRLADEEAVSLLAELPLLRPAFDPQGAIVVAVRARGELAGWQLLTRVPYGRLDLEVAARLAPFLAEPVMVGRPALRQQSAPRPSCPAAPSLTAREAEILGLVGEGLKARAIARRCGISERTVQKHLEQVYRKLDCHDRLSALLLAQDAGLLGTGGPVLAS